MQSSVVLEKDDRVNDRWKHQNQANDRRTSPTATHQCKGSDLKERVQAARDDADKENPNHVVSGAEIRRDSPHLEECREPEDECVDQ